MLKVLAEAAAIGMEIDVEYAHQVMQIPRAEEGRKVLHGGAAAENRAAEDPGSEEQALTVSPALFPSPPCGEKVAAGPCRLQSRMRGSFPLHPDLPAAYAAQLAAACAPFEEALIQQIAAIVAESSDFDEAAEKIEALRRDEETYKAWAKTLAEGMTAAHLAGRGQETGIRTSFPRKREQESERRQRPSSGEKGKPL
jgi:phage gp29-like protein